MGLINIASGDSVWRGLDYYQDKKVLSWKKDGPDIYDGMVSGSSTEPYTVHIDKQHPRQSSCNCPFAAGRRVICKHMIALLFTVEPKAAKDFRKEVEKYKAEEAQRERQHYEDLKKYVNHLSKAELQTELLSALVQLEERRNYYW